MRRLLAVVLVAGLIFASTTGLPGAADETNEPPGSSGDPGEPQRIGAYQRVVGSDDLTLDHVEQTENGIRVKGPSLTSTLRVESGFLDAELGPGWGASQAFTIDGDEIMVPARSVAFEPLQLGSDPVFTMGADDQIAFQERPMWISVEQPGYGDQITLEMDDGDTQGQQVFISKEWLWDRGIHRPHVVHEDGTNLTAVATEERDGWMIEMHHFSLAYIQPSDKLVMSRHNGIVAMHFAEVRMYDTNMRLEIDVDNHLLGTYEVLIDKDWVEMELPLPAPQNHDWVVDEIDGDDYYVIGLSPSQTPTTVFVRTQVVLVDGGDGVEMFTGEIIWDEDKIKFVVKAYQNNSSSLNYYVSSDWINTAIPEQLNVSHEYSMVQINNGPHFFLECCVADDLLDIIFEYIPGVESRAIIDKLLKAEIGGIAFRTHSGGDDCNPYHDNDLVYMGGAETPEWKGEKSNSNYDNYVDVCYWMDGDDPDFAYIFWSFHKTNDSGKHLTHATGTEDPCDDIEIGRAYCIRLKNTGGDRFVDYTPDEDFGKTDCSVFTLGYTDNPTPFDFEWTSEMCDFDMQVQATGSNERRWTITNKKNGAEKHMKFDYGVVQKVSVDSKGDFEGVVDVDMMTRFHCFYSGGSCVMGYESWTLSAGRSTEVSFEDQLSETGLPIGNNVYSFTELLEIVDHGNKNEALDLATTLIGAKLLIEVGAFPSVATYSIIAEADTLLGNYAEKLPWNETTSSQQDIELMIETRNELLKEFVHESPNGE